jgi:osmotically inducible protein OsmC
MPIRKASARWEGDLPSGSGVIHTGLGEGSYTFKSRFEEGPGTNPEELIAAAHAGCFSMAFANKLAQAGFTPDSVETTANVHLEKTDAGMTVTRIDLVTDATVPGIDKDQFDEIAQDAKATCPISRLLSPGAEITLNATLA